MNDELWVSYFSVLFYGFLCAFSADQFVKFYHCSNGSKNAECRKLFFGVLSISAILDLPIWFLCISYMGPSTCVVENVMFPMFQCFHMLALCGYAFCLGITTMLWSDILTENDDKPLFDFRSLDRGRAFFYVCISLYFVNELVVILSIIFWMDPNDPNHFVEYNAVYRYTDFSEPPLICLFAFGCLFTGIRLQKYVVSVQLGSKIQREFLIQLNSVLFIVTACYLLRAIFVFTMFDNFGSDEIKRISFGVWTLCTRWLPNVGSSLCLFVFMCRSQSNSNNKRQSHHLSLSQPDSYSWSEPLVQQRSSDGGPLSDPDYEDQIPTIPPNMMNNISPNPVFRYERVSRSFSEPETDEQKSAMSPLPFPKNLLVDIDEQ